MSTQANFDGMATAVLVIDVQQGLFETTPPPAQADNTIERINALTTRARQAAAPVIFILHEQAAAGLIPETPAWELDARLQVQDHDHRVRKTTCDSFLRTDLGALLQSMNINHLVICGYATEFCVDSTIRRAAGLGYAITIAADAHTTHDKPHASGAQIRAHHNATLPAISSFGVRIEAVESDLIDFN
jgi:nicotinamidase-related amidase